MSFMKVVAWPSSSHMMPKQLTQDELASQIPCQAVIITFVLQGAGPSSGANLLCCQMPCLAAQMCWLLV